MFKECSNILSLRDISNWSTNKVINIREMFYGCTKLSILPDISKLDTNNIINMKYIYKL